jgi:acetyl esterase/lipase
MLAGCPPPPPGYIKIPDVRYATTPGVEADLQSLDIYLPDPAPVDPMPVVIWVHGGGWAIGDKANQMQYKPALFTGAGYCFVSINYRLSPDPPDWDPSRIMHPIHVQDVAAAIAWVHEHAGEYGGDPSRIGIMGHSAGAHLVSLVSTDASYLGSHALPLSVIRGTASIDVDGYDIPGHFADEPGDPVYRNPFGDDPLVWADASPINHVAAGKSIPPHLFALRGSENRRMRTLAFADSLEAVGVATTRVEADVYSHDEVNSVIGAPGETVITPPLMAFFEGVFGGI